MHKWEILNELVISEEAEIPRLWTLRRYVTPSVMYRMSTLACGLELIMGIAVVTFALVKKESFPRL